MKQLGLVFIAILLATTSSRADCPGDAQPMRERWRGFSQRLAVRGSDGDHERVYRELAARYCEPHRAYHTLVHVKHALDELEEARELASDPEAVEFALWFHDVVYEIGARDNEAKSARLAQEAVRDLGLSDGFADRVSALVLATRHDAAPSTGDAQLVVDIDLSILGQPWERFDAYEMEIRTEYAPVIEERGEDGFNAGRAGILRRFLERPAIYSTEHFRTKYEEPARANLRRSIERLEDPSWTEAVEDRHNPAH